MELVALSRGVGPYQWRADPCELMGKSLGIVGLGALGQAVAHLALAYRMSVAYHSTARHVDWEARGAANKPLDDLLSESDIVVLSSPTNALVLGAEQFAHMHKNGGRSGGC